MTIQLLKVAKFYSRLYGGWHKLAPNIQTSVNFCNFAEHPFQNLSLRFILEIFLKFCRFQPRYSYKIYSYNKIRVYIIFAHYRSITFKFGNFTLNFKARFSMVLTSSPTGPYKKLKKPCKDSAKVYFFKKLVLYNRLEL